VHLAVEAHKELAQKNDSARVVSMPCLDVFQEQDENYIHSVLGKDLPKIAIEAGVRQGWDALIGREGGFIGMDSFGASAPGGELFPHFGITTEAIVKMALDKVKG
jgi:transketolase